MPYNSVVDLPKAQTDQYNPHQKKAFLEAFNNAYKEYGGDESRAFAVAHSAAKKAGGEVYALIIGSGAKGLAQQAGKYGATKVFACEDTPIAAYNPEIFSDVTAKLLKDGVASFSESFDALMKAIRDKRRQLQEELGG